MHDNWISEGKPPNDGAASSKNDTLDGLGEIVIGKRIEEFFSEVSVVGLKYVAIAGAAYIRKAIWLFFVLGGLGFMIFQFYDRFVE